MSENGGEPYADILKAIKAKVNPQNASGRARILVCSHDLSIMDFLEIDAGFVWVGVARVRVYSGYFSPNDPFEILETQILLFEKSLKEDYIELGQGFYVQTRSGGSIIDLTIAAPRLVSRKR